MLFSFSQGNFLHRESVIILLTKVFITVFLLFTHSLPHASQEKHDLPAGPQRMLALQDFSLLSHINKDKLTYMLTEEEKGREGPLG